VCITAPFDELLEVSTEARDRRREAQRGANDKEARLRASQACFLAHAR